jgi:protein-S-isoprenylcysteine O-methyltransferase Ste14
MLPLAYSIPLLIIGGTIAFYWQQVLHMARRQRKRTGKAANLIPPEPLGRALRLIWAPAIVLWISHPIASAFWWNPPAAFTPLFATPWHRWLCAVAVVAGMIVTRRCWKRMGKSWRMGIDPNEKTSLVFDGLFGYVRHPIYALSAGMMFATMVALPSPAMLAAGVVHIGLLMWESAREERHLVAAHGDAYLAYQKHVGRLVPRSLRPYRT